MAHICRTEKGDMDLINVCLLRIAVADIVCMFAVPTDYWHQLTDIKVQIRAPALPKPGCPHNTLIYIGTLNFDVAIY